MPAQAPSSRTTTFAPRREDEFPHALPDTPTDLPFKDTWWLAFRDDRADVSFSAHLTLSPNRRPGLRVGLAVQSGRNHYTRTHLIEPTVADGTVSSAVTDLEIVDPEWSPAKRLVLRVHDRDLQATLEFAGRYFGVDSRLATPGLIPDGDGIQNLGHAEQAMWATGELQLGDQQIRVDGPAYRDRSWGLRKSDKMAPQGYTFAQVHLPDAAVGLLAWQHPDAAAGAPLPVGAWLSDESGVHPATSGLFHLSAEARGQQLALDFTNGRKVALTARRALADLHYPYHEPEMDGPALGTLCWDQHIEFDSDDGVVAGLVNLGIPFGADVLRHSQFCTPDLGRKQ